MASIASSIDGRLRVRVPELRGTSALAECQTALAAIPGVSSVACNARIGSLLVYYEIATHSRASMEAQVFACLGRVPAEAAGAGTLAQAGQVVRQRVVKWVPARRDINRYAKFGAVVSMAVSLLAIAARQRRLHVWSGVAALALTGVHMTINRRNLLR